MYRRRFFPEFASFSVGAGGGAHLRPGQPVVRFPHRAALHTGHVPKSELKYPPEGDMFEPIA
jgi:hypothetical protein